MNAISNITNINSCKGGVGKSITTVNLTLALAELREEGMYSTCWYLSSFI
ncbi:MAG: P-loop NTPase [Arsenophonus sp. NC-WZS1-MAG3]